MARDRGTAVLAGHGQQPGDRGAQAAIPPAGRADQVQRHGDRLADRVAVGVQDAGGQVAGVQVHRQQSLAAGLDLFWGGRGGRVR
jgi:hypothetical protein